jgi:hypothetical protein
LLAYLDCGLALNALAEYFSDLNRLRQPFWIATTGFVLGGVFLFAAGSMPTACSGVYRTSKSLTYDSWIDSEGYSGLGFLVTLPNAFGGLAGNG